MGRSIRIMAVVAAVVGAAGCTMGLERIHAPPRAVALTTTGPWQSMIYLARTDSGVVVVDVGWTGADDALDRGLERLGATRDDVTAVFLTHSHRDHMAGWKAVRHARFYMAAPEVPLFTGQEPHRGLIPRLVEWLVESDRPRPGELDIRPFSGDTAIAFGADTVYAFPVPGHTAGSTAYLFRGVLFAGDALAYTPLRGFHHAKLVYSADVDRSRGSLAELWDRLEAYEVETVCTAHAKCTVPDASFRQALVQ